MLPEERIERYELLGELATGGMATVYLGRQRGPFGFARTVAIKSMHPQFAKDEGFRAMFLDEATLTARIRHPNVVPTLDIVCAATKVLLVMEYVEGASLSALVRTARKRKTPIPAPIAVATSATCSTVFMPLTSWSTTAASPSPSSTGTSLRRTSTSAWTASRASSTSASPRQRPSAT
jgi:serine/threonine protein kinase